MATAENPQPETEERPMNKTLGVKLFEMIRDDECTCGQCLAALLLESRRFKDSEFLIAINEADDWRNVRDELTGGV